MEAKEAEREAEKKKTELEKEQAREIQQLKAKLKGKERPPRRYPRIFPHNDRIKEILRKLLKGRGVKPDDFVFWNYPKTRSPLNEQTISRIMTNAAKKALLGVEGQKVTKTNAVTLKTRTYKLTANRKSTHSLKKAYSLAVKVAFGDGDPDRADISKVRWGKPACVLLFSQGE